MKTRRDRSQFPASKEERERERERVERVFQLSALKDCHSGNCKRKEEFEVDSPLQLEVSDKRCESTCVHTFIHAFVVFTQMNAPKVHFKLACAKIAIRVCLFSPNRGADCTTPRHQLNLTQLND